MELSKIKSALEDGLLSFPITDFNENGEFSADAYADRIEWFVNNDVSSIFVAGGTGEFFSLSASEYEQIIKVSVETTAGRVPVISSIGRSIPEAISFAKMAENAGIDALLFFIHSAAFFLRSSSVKTTFTGTPFSRLFFSAHCFL